MGEHKRQVWTVCTLAILCLGHVGMAFASESPKIVDDILPPPSYQQAQKSVTSPPIDISAQLNVPPAKTANIYDVFIPQKQTSHANLDYSIWGTALKESVVKMGQSLRIRAPRKNFKSIGGASGNLGSRITRGHKSPYRLEGSRITFSYLSDRYIETLSAYREDLVSIANERDLQTYSRKEQLVF